MKRLRLLISGRVQGVCFRAETQRKASALGVTGWVRNLEDGSVEAVAEGNEPMLNELAAWCAHGPPGARVDQIRQTWEPATDEFKVFSIT